MEMQRNKIVAELYKAKYFNDCINKMEPDYLREDLKNEVALVLLNKRPETIIQLHARNELQWYVVRIILNMVRSSSSPFTKQYRRQFENVGVIKESEIECLQQREQRELTEDRVMHYINTSLYWYDKEIINLYIKLGSYRAIEKETGIPWESCYGTIKRIKNDIRVNVLNEN